MRHLELGRHFEPHDFARQYAETVMFTVFVTFVEEHLQAEADSEKRALRLDVFENRFDEVLPSKFGNRITEGADSWENQPVGATKLFGF